MCACDYYFGQIWQLMWTSLTIVSDKFNNDLLNVSVWQLKICHPILSTLEFHTHTPRSKEVATGIQYTGDRSSASSKIFCNFSFKKEHKLAMQLIPFNEWTTLKTVPIPYFTTGLSNVTGSGVISHSDRIFVFNSYSLETRYGNSSIIALHVLKFSCSTHFWWGLVIASIACSQKSAVLCLNLELRHFR